MPTGHHDWCMTWVHCKNIKLINIIYHSSFIKNYYDNNKWIINYNNMDSLFILILVTYIILKDVFQSIGKYWKVLIIINGLCILYINISPLYLYASHKITRIFSINFQTSSCEMFGHSTSIICSVFNSVTGSIKLTA